MRGIGRIAPRASALALVAATLWARTAAADTMDPALARLVTDKNCRVVGKGGGVYYNPQSGFTPCGVDNAAFAKLIAQYGAAIAPTAMHSARTTGYGGFELALEAAYTTIDSNASYWKNGTQGPQDPVTKNSSVVNESPPSVLQLYQLKIRKGFPFGIELAGNFGYLAQSSLYTIGADVRWSLFEGFRTGVPAIFPELAVGGSVRTVTGTDQFQLTVVGADGELSKPIPIGGVVVLTPYVGYQFLRIFGDSGLIDLTPNTDATNYCGFTGPNTPANPNPVRASAPDGQPVCKSGSSADFNNTAVFDPARLNRHRLFGGFQLRIQMVKLGAQFMYDLLSPGAANKTSSSVNPYSDVARQMTFSFDVGAVF